MLNAGIKWVFLLVSIFHLSVLDQTCKFADKITSFENNAMTKIWVADTVPLSTNENAMLNGLQYSPVAFGSYVSTDIFDYSGGNFDMLIVI